jgi:hypothetical protein
MNVSGAGAVLAVAVVQGGLVALPRGNALKSLRRLRSPAWAAVLPGCIVVGTFAPLGARSFGVWMFVLAALATPPLAAVAVVAVVRGPRAILIALALAATVLALLGGGWPAELSATVLTALGALAIGAALARLIPARWVVVGFVCMCVLDVALLAGGVGEATAGVIARAAGHLPGPAFDHAQIGRIALDYPDLVLDAALGAFVAGQRGQRQAAAMVTLLAVVCLLVAPPDTVFPATIPVAVTLIALRVVGLPGRRKAAGLVAGVETVAAGVETIAVETIAAGVESLVPDGESLAPESAAA